LTATALVTALALACRHLDVDAIGAALRRAHVIPFALAVLVNLVARTVVRVRRTQLLLDRRVPFLALVRLQLAGQAAASVLPGPAEELVACTQLARTRGFSLRELASFQLTDKALGVSSIGFVALALLPLYVALPVGALAFVLVARAAPRLVEPFAWLIVSNALCIAMVALCVAAVGADAAPTACVEVFLATSLTSVVALTPGGIGTLESAFAITAIHGGMPSHLAVAAAILYRIAHVIPPALAGLPALWRISQGSECAPS
jgi:hypothetical protein